MKKRYFLVIAALVCTHFAKAQHAFMEQNLLDKLQDAGVHEAIPILLMLEDAVDVQGLKAEMIAAGIPVDQRPPMLIKALKQKAKDTQAPLLSYIRGSAALQGEVRHFWISNSMAFTAKKELIEALSLRNDVAYMALDQASVGLHIPEKGETSMAKSEGGIEPGLAAVGAPELWAMGYTGNGRIALTFDTGVWHDHPSITQRFLANMMPLAQTWFGYDSPFPVDKSSSHGTHVTGTMLGLDPATADTIGVAPRAYFIATDPVVSNIAFLKPLSDFMFGFEWALNPDGDEDSVDDIPDVINNSWGFWEGLGEPPCPEFVVPVFNAIEAAGIANVFSAGNSGPDPMTLGVPHNINTGLVNSFTVGAVNGNVSGPEYPIANFSSRGPSLCGGEEGSILIKPEVSAPGVNVRSAVGHSGYDNYSGTSMAAPHVSGVVMLLKEAFPYLSGEEILLAIYYSAIDQGEPGEDNTYGMGTVSAPAAFAYLSQLYDPVPPASSAVDLALLAIVATDNAFLCTQPENNTVSPVAVIKNNGMEAVSSFTLRCAINGGVEEAFTASDVIINPGQVVEITLAPIPTGGGGDKELHCSIDPLPDEYDLLNNNAVDRWQQLFNVNNGGANFMEDFDYGLDSWTVVNPDIQTTWDTAFVIQKDGTMGHAAVMRFYGYTPILNQKDYLISPGIWNPQEGLELRFDYFYRKVSSSNTTQDTLKVYALSNCGNTRIDLWKKGGSELWTVPVNWADAFPQAADDWQTVELSIDFPSLPEDVNIIFEGINRAGNNLLIDNVMIGSSLSAQEAARAPEVQLIPNPAQAEVRMVWSEAQGMLHASIYDLSGKLLAQKNGLRSGALMELNGLDSGLYLVEMHFDNGARTVAKLVVQH